MTIADNAVTRRAIFNDKFNEGDYFIKIRDGEVSNVYRIVGTDKNNDHTIRRVRVYDMKYNRHTQFEYYHLATLRERGWLHYVGQQFDQLIESAIGQIPAQA